MRKRTVFKIIGLIIYLSAIIGMIQLEAHIHYLDSINSYEYYGLEEMFWAFSFVLLLMFGMGWGFAENGSAKQRNAIASLKYLMGEEYKLRYEQLDILGGITDILKLFLPHVEINAVNVSVAILVFIVFSTQIIACNCN